MFWIPARLRSGSASLETSTSIDVRVKWRISVSVPDSTARPRRMIVTRSQRASTSASTWLESRTVLSRLLEHLLYQGIEAGRGLVQQQQLHIGRQGGDDPDLLLVALGVGTTFLRGVEVEALEQFGAPLGVEPATHPPEQVDDLAAGKVRPQRDVAGHVGQAPVQFGGLAPWVPTEQSNFSGVLLACSTPTLMVVVFPEPFGPRKPCTSPVCTVRSSPSRGRVRPKDLTRPAIEIAAGFSVCIEAPHVKGARF
jgi:hypothetical protein